MSSHYNPTIYVSTEPTISGSSQNNYEWNNLNSPKLLVRGGMSKPLVDFNAKRTVQDGLAERKVHKYGNRLDERSHKFNIRTIETPKAKTPGYKISEDPKSALELKNHKIDNQDSAKTSTKPGTGSQEPRSAGLEDLGKREFRKNLVLDTDSDIGNEKHSKLRSFSTKGIKPGNPYKGLVSLSPTMQDAQAQDKYSAISSNRVSTDALDASARESKSALIQMKKKYSLKDGLGIASAGLSGSKSSQGLNKYLSQTEENTPEKKVFNYPPTNPFPTPSSAQTRNLKFNNYNLAPRQQEQSSRSQKIPSEGPSQRKVPYFDDDYSDEEFVVIDRTQNKSRGSSQQKDYHGKSSRKTESLVTRSSETISPNRPPSFQFKGSIDVKKPPSNSQPEENSASLLNGLITRVNQGESGLKSTPSKFNQKEQTPEPLVKSPPSIDDPSPQVKSASVRVNKQTISLPGRGGSLLQQGQRRFVRAMPGPISSSQDLKPTTKTATAMQPGYSKGSFVYYVTNMHKYHKYPHKDEYLAQLYREHFIQTYQSLNFCKTLRPVDPKVLSSKTVHLDKRDSHKDKKTLIFDLDETLIHCNESTLIPYDVKLPIKFPGGETIEAGINIRPYAIEILKEMSALFEIIVFTASHSCYANVVLDYLDPKKQYIHHRLFRENCVQTPEGVYVKDLRIFANRDLNDLILVDNAAYSFGNQIQNGIPIIPYYNNKEDMELKSLMPYLRVLAESKDLTEVIRQTFKLEQYTQYDSADAVLEKVVLGV